ncbi:hypothetical protein C1I98_07875 [Spongiactinospora gelatinilytica]|uniref:Uncharacterized protein n=2 Tax=Spongiactinospora gelatinilytica TaxID=2666298 RepID=A0A2W2GR19_9ACTN|nr:hypothetical protein C1I98_07875 [Spongiactinospora gelatinilytica]
MSQSSVRVKDGRSPGQSSQWKTDEAVSGSMMRPSHMLATARAAALAVWAAAGWAVGGARLEMTTWRRARRRRAYSSPPMNRSFSSRQGDAAARQVEIERRRVPRDSSTPLL